MIREGFWRWSGEPDLPLPLTHAEPWPSQEAFVTILARVAAKAEAVTYRGVSRCRVCGQCVGNLEYRTSGATWPEGLFHYIVMHNVRPSQAFYDHITTPGVV